MKKAIIISIVSCLIAVASITMVFVMAGKYGIDGINGIDGVNGVDGKDGKDGKDGVTPTIEISEDGYWVINGVKTEYVAIGKDGAQGEQGIQGEQGAQGIQGVQGAQGAQGIQGAQGAQGIQGEQGVAPTIEISEDGYWIINGVKTEYVAIGKDGAGYAPGAGGANKVEIIDGFVWVNGINTGFEVKDDNSMDSIEIKDNFIWVNGTKTEIEVNGCAHAWETTTIDPTCTSKGYDIMHCPLCGSHVKANETKKIEHEYQTTYTTDNSFHYYKCKNCSAKKDKELHDAEDDICSICQVPVVATPGVAYDLSADGTHYIVVGYSGTATTVRIADMYNNLPVKTIYSEAFNNNDSITQVIISDNITSIGNNAFYDCDALTSISIPDSVTSIGYRAFSSCGNLTSVEIGNSVTSIGYEAFYNCYALTSVEIGNSVTSIGNYAFYNCYRLTSITIPDSVTSIGTQAFYECSNLTSIKIDNGAINIGSQAFSSCNSSLYTEYEYGKYVRCGDNPYAILIDLTNDNMSTYDLHEDTQIIAYGVFSSCERLTSITIPDGVTSIGTHAFSSCSALTYITIPDSVTSIGNYAFDSCSALTSITIPDSVTSIGSSTFESCSALTSITIPDSVTSIGSSAFYGCSKLADVYYTGTQEQWNLIEIDSNYYLNNATKHYNYVPQ